MRHDRAFASLAIFLALLVIVGCGGGSGGGASSGPQTGPNAPEPPPLVSPYTAVVWSAALTPADGGDRGGGQGVSPSGYCQDGVCGSNIDRPAFGALTTTEFNFDGTTYLIESIRYGVDHELKLGLDPMIPTHVRADWALRIGAAEFPLRTTFQENRHDFEHEFLVWDVPDNPNLDLSRAPWTIGTPIEVQMARIPPAEISVADAQVQEGPDARLDFVVTLSKARFTPTTVAYATSDGMATAGADYTETSGTLTFGPLETSKTVSVPVLDDAHDEGSEMLTLTLSDPDPGGVRLADATATGTISNTDAMPKAWLARFGRTVATQVIDTVEGRFAAQAAAGVEVSLAGQRVGGGSATADPQARDEAAARARLQATSNWLRGRADKARSGSRSVTPRELLTGSSFALTAEVDGGNGGAVSFWGRAAVSRFDGRDGDLSLDGEVVSGLLGRTGGAAPGRRGC